MALKPVKDKYEFNDKLNNGGTVLDHNTQAGVVLARYQGQFVTWRIDKHTDTWSGHYFKTLHEAISDYEKRIEERTGKEWLS